MTDSGRVESWLTQYYLPEPIRISQPLVDLRDPRVAYRSSTLDGEEIEFSSGFHIADARPSIELVHRLREARPVAPADIAHPTVG